MTEESGIPIKSKYKFYVQNKCLSCGKKYWSNAKKTPDHVESCKYCGKSKVIAVGMIFKKQGTNLEEEEI